MKIAKQMRRKPSPPKSFIIMDEFHLLAGEPACSTAMQSFRRPNTGFIATQAVMRSNSGKRLRFLGSTKRADGSPLKPAPKKFIPAHVQRRLAD